MDRLKTFRNTAVALACTLLAFSCSNEDDSGTLPAGDYPMTFIGSVEQQLTRSSSANSWDGGESVAIKIGNQIKEYTAAASNMLTAKSGIEPFYWQTHTGMKTVEAWYPYSSDTPNSWSVKADQSAGGYQESDLLYAPATTIPFSARNTTQLKFYHQTAKVVINIINADAATDPSQISSVTIGYINNLALSGDYATPIGNATRGTWNNQSTMGTITPQTLTLSGNYLKSYAALIIPQDMTSQEFITITLSNNNIHYYIPQNQDAVFESGKQYTYNITVKNTGIIVSTSNINNWDDTANPPISGGAGIWKVGDYYPDPNVDLNNAAEKAKIKGVVFWVDPSDGRHGKVVGLQEITQRWGAYPKDESADVSGIRSTTDGKTATRNLIEKRKDQPNFVTDYFVFNWIYQIMNGGNLDGVWYIPALNELESIYKNKNTVNSSLSVVGDTGLNNSYYWSSSENSSIRASNLKFDDGSRSWESKSNYGKARCVLAF